MEINNTMNLYELAEHMGDDATVAHARHMRATLDGIGRYTDTDDVPRDEWLRMLYGAVVQAEYDE